MSFVVETLINDLRNEVTGELTDKSRVTDRLLDIRLAAVGRPTIIAEVDRTLADIPGLTMVENDWWRAVLDGLEKTSQGVPAT